jgi:hypothetical protein
MAQERLRISYYKRVLNARSGELGPLSWRWRAENRLGIAPRWEWTALTVQLDLGKWMHSQL